MAATPTLPLHQLLGIPLADLVDAEKLAAEASANFIAEFGFSGSHGIDALGELRFLTFRYTAGGPGGGKATHEVRVPLLSVLPIPLYQVAKAEFEFRLRIDNLLDPKKSELKRSELLATFASLEAPGRDPTIRVKLEVTQSDLPSGLALVLRKLELAADDQYKAS